MARRTVEMMKRREQRAAAKKALVERHRVAMKYRALLTIDYTHIDKNEYQKLLAGLIQTGWRYLETSALVFEGDLTTILHSMELIVRQCRDGGVISALNLQIQGSLNFAGVDYPGARNHPNAVDDIKKKPLAEPNILPKD